MYACTVHTNVCVYSTYTCMCVQYIHMYVCTVHTHVLCIVHMYSTYVCTVHVQHQTHLAMQCKGVRHLCRAQGLLSSPLTEVNSPRCAVSNVVAQRGLFPVVHLHCRVEGGSIRLGGGGEGTGGEGRRGEGEGGGDQGREEGERGE